MAVGAIVGLAVGAAFATERSRRVGRAEREQKAALEESFASLKMEFESRDKAAVAMEEAKVALEARISQLERTASMRTEEVKEATEARERLVATLKARVASTLKAIEEQGGTLPKAVLLRIFEQLEKDLFSGGVVVDENAVSVAKHGNVTVKSTIASPHRVMKLSTNNVFQDSTNSRANEGGRLRIPFFSKPEKQLQQAQFPSLPNIAARRPELPSSRPDPRGADGSAPSRPPASLVVSPGKGTVIVQRKGKAEAAGKRRGLKLTLFEKPSRGKGVEAAKENVGPAEATEEASALLRRGGEYEYEDDAKFGSSIVIKSHP